jgi:hypothetical protein
LRRYGTSRKVAGSSPDEVTEFFFNLPTPFSRTMALGFIQLLTEMSTRRYFWSRARPARNADNFTAICEPIVYSKECGILDISQPYRPSLPVTGIGTYSTQGENKLTAMSEETKEII